jgi:hypothetical protein
MKKDRLEWVMSGLNQYNVQYKGIEKWNGMWFVGGDRKEARDKTRVQSSGAFPVKKERKGS